ncbi:MAG: NADP-dependent phosphogluconate dehydrogenase [Pseudomonadota bacterium]
MNEPERNEAPEGVARIGVTGMGTMGAALALNIAERGFPVSLHNRSPERVEAVMARAGALAGSLVPTADLEGFVRAIARPRTILIMVPAGAPVRSTIEALRPLLAPGDTLIDGGNADFHDTRATTEALAGSGLNFIGMGVSGGEDGARHGPSIMVGGPPEAYDPVQDIVEAIAAKYDGAPCAAWLGPDGAGHFVKTVHNGIEYADMQLIAEIYGLLRHGRGQSPADIAESFAAWNAGVLKSYLVEITAEVLRAVDPATGVPFVDVIVDAAGQKGTGRWTVIEALRLGQSASTIEAAVGARAWSAARSARAAGEAALPGAGERKPDLSDAEMRAAFLAARILAYGQGMALLAEASETYGWGTDLARVAEIWRAGCIIRSALLDDIAHAVRAGLPEGMLHLAPAFLPAMAEGLPALRKLVSEAALSGQPVPGFGAALGFAETLRRARGTADLIQGQRDFFGRHGFARLDADGAHHGPWAG